MNQRVIIVGGGLAGLAAASALGPGGYAVTLLESRPRWGGRASSFVDGSTGEKVDNCQHVSMGCCTNFAEFCRTIGVAEFFRRERRLWFFGPDGKASTLAASPLPAPLHLFPALLRLKFLSPLDKLRLALGLRALARTDPEACGSETFQKWLERHGQPPRVIERFWHVVLVSALSETLDRIGVLHARKVFADGFLAHRAGWEVLLPTVSLDELYGDRLTQWFDEYSVDTRLQCGVKQVLFEGGLARGVELRSGEFLESGHVILAVPHTIVSSLLPEEVRSLPELAGIEKLESAPISSVHLWFDRSITDLPHATFIGRLSQWMFNRTAIRDLKQPETHYYQVVISASRELAGRPQQDVIDEVLRELGELWPVTHAATLRHSRLVTEHKAALSMLPGVDAQRPVQQSAIANLQWAGDWTKTGWPSTMEGAVRSGYLAAENVLRGSDRPEKLVHPDLPAAFLSRVLFGL